MLSLPRHRVAALAAGLLLAFTFLSACGGDDGGGTTQATGADDPAAFAQAAEGPHRYSVAHENLGSCTGAPEDGEWSFDITLQPDGLTLAAIDSWTMQFEEVAANEYYRLEVGDDGYEWHKTLTLTADGFVLYSETNDPTQVGEVDGPQPCLRYTYTRLD